MCSTSEFLMIPTRETWSNTVILSGLSNLLVERVEYFILHINYFCEVKILSLNWRKKNFFGPNKKNWFFPKSVVYSKSTKNTEQKETF